MTEINENGLNDQEDYLDTDNDKMQDAGNADAAKFNTDEQERFANEREDTSYANDENLEGGATEEQHINQPPLTTQGDIKEIEENMGGTTNLTLDQLKQEHDPEGRDGE
jgi:hypothetical protein